MLCWLLLSPSPIPQEPKPDYWGTITLLEEGAKRVPATGWIHFCLQNGLEQRVPVVDGAWSCTTGWLDIMEIGAIELDGAPAFVIDGINTPYFAMRDWSKRGHYAFEAKIAPNVILRAIDAETGVDLDEVVAADFQGEAIETIDRGRGQSPLRITQSLRPCVGLESWRPHKLVCVDATGYVGTRLTVDFLTGGLFEVSLERRGSLIVYAAPDADHHDTYSLRIPDQDRRTLRRQEPAILRDIEPGWHTLEVRADGRLLHQEAVQMGSEDTILTLSKERLTMALEPPREAHAAPPEYLLEGTITVPDRYGLASLTTRVERRVPGEERFELRGSFAGQRESDGSWTWAAGQQPEGVYLVGILELPWAFLCELNADNSHQETTVPEPAKVTVRCVVSRRYDEVRADAISWAPLSPTSYETGLEPKAVKADEEGRIRFLAPVGETLVTVSHEGSHEGFETTTRRVTIRPGENAVVIPLRRHGR